MAEQELSDGDLLRRWRAAAVFMVMDALKIPLTPWELQYESHIPGPELPLILERMRNDGLICFGGGRWYRETIIP